MPHSEKFRSVASSDAQSIDNRTQKQYQASSERSECSPSAISGDKLPLGKNQKDSMSGSFAPFKPSFSEIIGTSDAQG